MKFLLHRGTKPSELPSRRMAIAMLFAGLVITHGAEEAKARMLRGGIAISGGGGGGAVTLTPWTITELSGSGQTNVPVEIFLPLGAGVLAGTSAIQVLDADGVTVLPCQEDNRGSDQAPGVRGLKLTVILPALTSSQKRQLTVQYLTSTTPATGTSITTANITATGYDCVSTINNNDGVTYTASAAAALAAGAWTNKTTAANFGKWRGRNTSGLCDEYIVTAPYMNGATPMPGNLCAIFAVAAFKASRAAVGGGNPIIAIKTRMINDGSFAQAAGATDWWYDLTVTSGTNSVSWVGASPAKTIIFGGNGWGTITTATVPAGGTTFTQNSVGMAIGDSAGGCAIICKYNSATSVDVRIGVTLSSTTLTSGNWRIYGINQGYASQIPPQEVWYGGSLAITAKPNLDSSLGVAWNTGTNTGGPFSYLVSTGMILGYTTPAVSITNDLSQLNICGNNPTSWVQNGQNYAGDITMGMPNTGGRPDIAPIPGWDVGAFIKFDANAKPLLFGNADKLFTIPISYRDQTTGKTMLLNNGSDYVYQTAFGVPVLPLNRSNPISNWSPQRGHFPGLYFPPYLLTGDFFYLDALQKQCFWIWSNTNPGSAGSQLNRLSILDDEQRGVAWSLRSLTQCILLTPDDNPVVLGWSKTHAQTWLTNTFTNTTNSGPALGSPHNGINKSYVSNVTRFSTPGPRFLNTGDAYESQWELGYLLMQMFNIQAYGMANADTLAFITWLVQGITGAFTSTDVVQQYSVPSYNLRLKDNSNAAVSTWVDCYHWACIDPGDHGMNDRLYNGGALTLSGLNGTALTTTAAAGYFTNGGAAFYTGGQLRDMGTQSLCGSGAPVTQAVTAASSSVAMPIEGGKISITNTGAVTVFASLSVGAGAANTGDTSIAPGVTWVIGNVNDGARRTNVNLITASGSSSVRIYTQGINAVGSGYAVNDTITLIVNDPSGKMTVTQRAVVTVKSVDGSGGVTSIQVTTPGIYTCVIYNDVQNFGLDASQFSTSGVGTGATFNNLGFQYGSATITGYASNVLTLNTTGTTFSYDGAESNYPFAQVGLVSGKVLIPGPAPGDNVGGSGFNAQVPIPYSSYYEYWDIVQQACKLAANDGYTDAGITSTWINTNYTGGTLLKWGVT